MNPPTVRQIRHIAWKTPTGWLAFGFGSGLAPVAPGTMGTLAALPLYCLLSVLPLWAYTLLVLAAFVVGVYVCGITSKRLGVPDYGGIVWDEFVGLWITLAAVPLHWKTLLAGFALFRLFDILKPWPIGWLDKKVHGGLGIMLDDALAGLYAWGLLQILLHKHWLGILP